MTRDEMVAALAERLHHNHCPKGADHEPGNGWACGKATVDLGDRGEFYPDGAPDGLRAALLSAAMGDAYDHAALPFYDDFEVFWDPFAAKVLAALAAAEEKLRG